MKQTKIERGYSAHFHYSAQLLRRIKLEVFVDRNLFPKTAGLAAWPPRPGDQLTTKLLQCMSLPLAQNGHSGHAQQCPLSGVKRKSLAGANVSSRHKADIGDQFSLDATTPLD